MWTKDKLEVFMASFGFKPIMTKPEIKELPSLLHPEEDLLGLLEGQLKRIHNRDFTGYGLAIVTNKRIIFFRKSIIGTVTKEETPITRVSSASFRKGLLSSSVAITTSNNESVIDHCDKTVGNKFVDVVQNLISDLDSKANQPVQTQPVQQDNTLAQLEKLFDLKQKGILTEDEFLAQKAKLLGQ
jgi:hypothetical protein